MNRRFARIVARLRSQVGESIVETLAAVIVCTLAILMLFTAVSVAMRMNVAADADAAEAREAVLAAESQEPTHDYREVVVDGFDETFYVEYYGSDDGSVFTYRYAEEARRWPV